MKLKQNDIVEPKSISQSMTVRRGRVIATATPNQGRTLGSDGETYYFGERDAGVLMCLVQWFEVGGATWWDENSLKGVK